MKVVLKCVLLGAFILLQFGCSDKLEKKWEINLSSPGLTPDVNTAVGSTSLYIAIEDSLFSINANDGQLMWKKKIPTTINNISLYKDSVLVVCDLRDTYLLNKERWRRTF